MGWLSQIWIWLALAIVVLLMMRRGSHAHFAGGYAGHDHDAQEVEFDRGTRTSALEATVDPVNGEPVRKDSALTTLYQGSIYYFASRASRDRFEAAPRQYAQLVSGHRMSASGAADDQSRRPRGS